MEVIALENSRLPFFDAIVNYSGHVRPGPRTVRLDAVRLQTLMSLRETLLKAAARCVSRSIRRRIR
jgi:hypothetical protein